MSGRSGASFSCYSLSSRVSWNEESDSSNDESSSSSTTATIPPRPLRTFINPQTGYTVIDLTDDAVSTGFHAPPPLIMQ
jgi:hypothetical protein